MEVFSADATDVRQGEYDLGYLVDQNITATKWAAPEVLDLLWSEASDVWSFGVTCYELWANGAEPGVDAETTRAALRRGQCHRTRPSQTLLLHDHLPILVVVSHCVIICAFVCILSHEIHAVFKWRAASSHTDMSAPLTLAQNVFLASS